MGGLGKGCDGPSGDRRHPFSIIFAIVDVFCMAVFLQAAASSQKPAASSHRQQQQHLFSDCSVLLASYIFLHPLVMVLLLLSVPPPPPRRPPPSSAPNPPPQPTTHPTRVLGVRAPDCCYDSLGFYTIISKQLSTPTLRQLCVRCFKQRKCARKQITKVSADRFTIHRLPLSRRRRRERFLPD